MVEFMSSLAGRWTRGIAGAVLIVVGMMLGGGWLALSVVGVVFVAVGAFDICLLAPLFGKPLQGKKVRGE